MLSARAAAIARLSTKRPLVVQVGVPSELALRAGNSSCKRCDFMPRFVCSQGASAVLHPRHRRGIPTGSSSALTAKGVEGCTVAAAGNRVSLCLRAVDE